MSTKPILLAGILATAGLLVAFISLAVMISESGGQFGPDVKVGWPNRFEIYAYCVWLIVVAAYTKKQSRIN